MQKRACWYGEVAGVKLDHRANPLTPIPLNGYVMRIYRGATQPPKSTALWGRLFIGGLKLIVLGIVYTIPVIIVWVIAYAGLITALLSRQARRHAGPTGFARMGYCAGHRASRARVRSRDNYRDPVADRCDSACRTTASLPRSTSGRSSNISGRFGWLSYILALILITIVVGIPVSSSPS